MKKIKLLRDSGGKAFYPETAIPAVKDGSGKSLYTILDEMNASVSGVTEDLSNYATLNDVVWEKGGGTGSVAQKGGGNTASGAYSVAEGNATSATGYSSHAEGRGAMATNSDEHAEGSYNLSNSSVSGDGGTIHSVGIGTADNARKNAWEIRRNGDLYCWLGDSYVKVQDRLSDDIAVTNKTVYASSWTTQADSTLYESDGFVIPSTATPLYYGTYDNFLDTVKYAKETFSVTINGEDLTPVADTPTTGGRWLYFITSSNLTSVRLYIQSDKIQIVNNTGEEKTITKVSNNVAHYIVDVTNAAITTNHKLSIAFDDNSRENARKFEVWDTAFVSDGKFALHCNTLPTVSLYLSYSGIKSDKEFVKANVEGVELISEDELAAELKDRIINPVVADGSITTDKIADSAVTESKLSGEVRERLDTAVDNCESAATLANQAALNWEKNW